MVMPDVHDSESGGWRSEDVLLRVVDTHPVSVYTLYYNNVTYIHVSFVL